MIDRQQQPRDADRLWNCALGHKKEKGVTAVGTMGYAPPELFSGQADPRVDIYSLGATMFHFADRI